MRIPLIASTLAITCALPTLAENASPMESLNQKFRQIYAQARQHVKDQTSPVVLCVNGKIVLLNKGTRQEHQVCPLEWHVLKTVDHVPLAIAVLLTGKTDTSIDSATKNDIRDLHKRINAVQSHPLFETTVPESIVNRQQTILSKSASFLESALSSGLVTKNELDSFITEMSALAMLNADYAEELELGATDKQVTQWRQNLSPEEWQKLHVLVCGSHMSRQGERYIQYFSALLNEKEEGHRIIYLEGSDDEQRALDLLATHELDADIAESFFRDKFRMHNDLLRDSAKKYLEAHPPKP